jgi:VanZ family protein
MGPVRFHRPGASLRTDVLLGALILAFTAAPTQLRVADVGALHSALTLQLHPFDAVVNVLGYVPLGFALATRRVTRGLLAAFSLSLFAEAVQLFSTGRDPALADVVTNVAGAGVGLALARIWRPLPHLVTIPPPAGLAAAVLAVVYVGLGASVTVDAMLETADGWIEAPPWMTTNPRGRLASGVLEGHWTFETIDRGVVRDVSGHGLRAAVVNSPVLVPGRRDSAVLLNGRQWLDLGNPVSLRLTGSMTLSAWVRPQAFPSDDAAIISSLTDRELGYQLDLTIDQGPRTMSFKISDGASQLVARYGRTPIVTDRWYHVAGVYDAESRTVDVYLDGRPDNGCLQGAVSGRPRPTGRHVFIGRRAGSRGYEFIGAIDEAEIESRALSGSEVALRAGLAGPGGEWHRERALESPPRGPGEEPCVQEIEPHPPRVAGMLISLGLAIGLACASLWQGLRLRLAIFVFCLLALVVDMLVVLPKLALQPVWLAVLYVFTGGAAVVLAEREARGGSSD